MTNYPTENLLREPTEFFSAMTLVSLSTLTWFVPHYLLLTPKLGQSASVMLLLLSSIRFFQFYRIKRYHHHLNKMPRFALSTKEIPISKEKLFIGRGFRWQPLHTQRLHQIKQIHNQKFIKHHKNPLGGQAYLHGVGDKDVPIFIPQHLRTGHLFVVGTTRVGKTRLASILINQDIRNNDAVIVVDPKGDLELVRDMYAACLAANRLQDFKIVHLGFPELSATYNPLKNFDQISEVATRITSAIDAEGEGKQFAAFAWKYVNIVAICLHEMNQAITYQSIAFYITRLSLLLVSYADFIFPSLDPNYEENIQNITKSAQNIDKFGRVSPPMDRIDALTRYIKNHIDKTIAAHQTESLHNQTLIELFDAATIDKHYYDKITASVGPVLSEINKSNASRIFSFKDNPDEIQLMTAITQKKVIYIGLDSLSNFNVAQAFGKAFLADLVSTAGKIYKDANHQFRLNFHCDELSEIIQDSFVKILNKAGGAGFQVTAYAQTKQDLEVALGSTAMAEMTEGNLNTLIMMRVKNEETANLLVRILPQVGVVGHTQVSMANDTPHGNEGIYFTTTNEDRIQTTNVPMLEISDIISLPKGQAFVFVNGGELYKIRIPMPSNKESISADIKTLIRQINNNVTAGAPDATHY